MSSTIRVLLFAGARERVGIDSIEVAHASAPTIRALRQFLAEHHDALAPMLPKVAFAVNEEYAQDHTELRPGDTVAVIPPVSGG